MDLGIGERRLERARSAASRAAGRAAARCRAPPRPAARRASTARASTAAPRSSRAARPSCPRPCRPRAGSARRARRDPGYARVVSNSCCTGGSPRTPLSRDRLDDRIEVRRSSAPTSRRAIAAGHCAPNDVVAVITIGGSASSLGLGRAAQDLEARMIEPIDVLAHDRRPDRCAAARSSARSADHTISRRRTGGSSSSSVVG